MGQASLGGNFGYLFLPLKTEVSSFIQYYSRYILLVFVAFNHVYRLVLVFYKLELIPIYGILMPDFGRFRP